MESSKRIFVVLSTILFLEASAFDSYSTFQQVPNNFGNNQQTRLPQNTFLNNPSPSTMQSVSSLGNQNNYQRTNLVSNSLQKSGQEYINSGSNFGPGSNRMGGTNIGQESYKFGDANIAQRSNQFGGLNIAQNYKQFGGANTDLGSNQVSGTNIGQESRPRGGLNIVQGSNQIGVSSIGSGANRIGGLGVGQGSNLVSSLINSQGPNSVVAPNTVLQSNQFTGLNIAQRNTNFGGSIISQDLDRQISGLNIGQGAYQFGGLKKVQGTSAIAGSSIAQGFNRFGTENIGRGSISNQFGGSDIGQGTNIGGSDVARGSTGNVQSAFNRNPSSDYVFTPHTGSNIGYGSNLNLGLNSGSSLNIGMNNRVGTSLTDAALNIAPKVTEISGTKSVYGSNLNNGLRDEFGSNVNTEPSLTSVYPLQQKTTSLTQRQIPTNAQFIQNYNRGSSNPITEASQPIQSHVGSQTARDDDKFRIVHVPIQSSSQSSQILTLPISENVKYKVLHVNPTETSLPPNVMTTVEGVKSNLQKAFELKESNKIGNYQSNTAQITIPNIAGVNTNQNKDTPSIAYYNYDSNKHLPKTEYQTLTQASQELKEIISTAPENKYGNLYDKGDLATNTFFNYNQPYYSSSNQATTSSISANVQDVTNIYDINFNKNSNPNNVMRTLINAEQDINKVLKQNKNDTNSKQGSQTISTIITSSTSPTETRNLYNSGYQYPPTNQLDRLPYDYKSQTIPSISYNNAQTTTSITSDDVISNGPSAYDSNPADKNLLNKVVGSHQLTDFELHKIMPSTEGDKQKYKLNALNNAFTTTSSLLSTSKHGYSQFPLITNNRNYYPETKTLQPYNQPYDHGSLTPSITSQSETSATAISSTSQNRPNLYSNYNNPNYYNSKPAHLTEVNTPQFTYSVSQHNEPYLNVGNDQSQYPTGGQYTNIDGLNSLRPIENHPSQQVTTNTAQPPEAYVSKSDTIIKNVPSTLNYNLNNYNYPLLGNYPDSSPNRYSQPNDYGKNYSVPDVPSSFKTSGTHKTLEDTTNQATAIDSSYLFNVNNETQSYDDVKNDNEDLIKDGESSNTESTATAVATSDISQSENATSTSVSNDQGAYIVYGQNYENQLYNIQTTDDTVSNNSTETGIEKDSQSSFIQTNSTSTIQTKYSPVEEYADSNTTIETDSYSHVSDDGSTQQQTVTDNTDDTVQDSMEYGNDNEVTSTAISSTDTVVSESTTPVADSESQDIIDYNRPLYYQPNESYRRRYLYGINHPRYHRLNWNNYGINVDPTQFIYPPSTNYPTYNYGMYHQLPSTENEEVSYSEIGYESTQVTDSESLYNIDNTTKAHSSTDVESDDTRQTIKDGNKYFVSSDTSEGQFGDGYSLNNQNIGKGDERKQSTITTTTDTNYDDEYSDGNSQESGKLIEADKSAEISNKQYLEVDKEQTTKVESSSSSSNITVQHETIVQEQDVTIQKEVQSSVYENNRTGFAKIGTILNTRPDGTPYSCAVEVLMKLIDTIERTLNNEGTV